MVSSECWNYQKKSYWIKILIEYQSLIIIRFQLSFRAIDHKCDGIDLSFQVFDEIENG